MKVKKFCAFDNHEAMMKIRADLGPDAVILHQRKIKQKGLFGYFKKPMIEVVAAIEEVEYKAPKTQKLPIIRPEEILRERLVQKQPQIKDEPVINKEISEIKDMLFNVMKKVNQEDVNDIIKNTDNQNLIDIYQQLKEHEIEEHILEKILNELNGSLIKSDESSSKELLIERFKEIIDQYIIDNKNSKLSKFIFFVGPTGVGKTTTIAKLAAHYSMNEGKKVAFISADTYRIAAVEQLKTYSDILSIPVEVIYEADEIHGAIEKLKFYDIIMVDTAGRSHKNEKQVDELKKLLEQINDKETYLVISCTSKNKDVKEIINTYNFIENYRIIFTKIDEATSYGTIINTAIETQKPISYITTGQSVPDDIELISVDKIVSLLIKEA
ncbi:flagellar biosynthesis protein FlhF [Alkaliphilus peptidifermentans]|uniref:Flagellar biosynthesis protein FlhF n=1 Tax=Alkaliphilus peptidifermentans DSM 18978 TaxID=1120976 RepID=A0A1G5DFU2_9FIRM|nr:flagellar biosynthesis protein FlhF [Alkaliphilus peptidifermentans]SCY13575.1 flagellar biosynthesis protein FlhF [Alkaliphilus peptidifermentans DSM 18978]